MEDLILLLNKARTEGKISGVKISRLYKIFNLFFVDDVLIMTRAQITKWREIDSSFSILCKALGLFINPLKLSFHFSELQEGELTCFKALFPYNFVELNEGFWYLGFFLKPANYRVADWSWLIERFEKRMGLWCHRWLSLGRRFVLVKAVLESLPVY